MCVYAGTLPGLHSLNSVEGPGLKGRPGRVPRGGSFRPGYRNCREGKKHINLYFILKNICRKVSFVCEGEGVPTHSPVEGPGAAGDVPVCMYPFMRVLV